MINIRDTRFGELVGADFLSFAAGGEKQSSAYAEQQCR